MNRALKIILISLSTIFSIGFLFIEPVHAAIPFVVEFQKGSSVPLFSEANFVPGSNVSRWIKVTNNTNNILKIATKATNVINDEGLGDVLNLEIKNGGVSLYNDTLKHFFDAGEVFLSDAAGNGTLNQYDYIVSFNNDSENVYQGKHLGFDILIGYEGDTTNDQTYTYIGGDFSTTTTTLTATTTTTTTIATTTTTRPGIVAGAQTEDLSSEGGVEQGAQNTTTTTTTTPGVVLGAATEENNFNWFWFFVGIILVGGGLYLFFKRRRHNRK